VKQLLAGGAQLNATDHRGNAALHLAGTPPATFHMICALFLFADPHERISFFVNFASASSSHRCCCGAPR
jgi:hypothetical protein